MSHQKDFKSSARRLAQPIIRRQQQNILRPWVPLGFTILAITVGISAWIWSERKDTDAEDYEDNDNTASDEDAQSNTPEQRESGSGAKLPPHDGHAGHGNDVESSHPHRSFESDNDNLSASMAMASASAMPDYAICSSEEDEDQADRAYHDHHTWEAEAESLARAKALDTEDSEDVHQTSQSGNTSGRTVSRRKTVAIVLSAIGNISHEAGDFDDANNSLLSYLPTDIDFSRARVFILILAPWLRQHPSDLSNADGTESVISSTFETFQSQAEAVVEKASMVFPFTAPSSYIQMLRQLKPDYVYLQNSFAGDNAVTQLQTWLRQDIVIVTGLRTDDEIKRVGRGKGTAIVDAKSLHEDFHRRIYQELV